MQGSQGILNDNVIPEVIRHFMYRDKSEKSQMASESINLDTTVNYFLSQINLDLKTFLANRKMRCLILS